MKKILSLFIACVILVSTVSVSAASFSDITGHWAHDAIVKWGNSGVINGYDGKFSPNDELTRAQMATILSNLLVLNKTTDNIYKDINESDWFYESILKCTASGIMYGDGENASPNAQITREAAMVMLCRALKIDEETNLNRQFNDSADISSWAVGYVYALINNGYVNGKGDNTLLPKANITRAEVVTILNNIIDLYINKSGAYKINAEKVIVVAADNVQLVGDTSDIRIIVSPEFELVDNSKEDLSEKSESDSEEDNDKTPVTNIKDSSITSEGAIIRPSTGGNDSSDEPAGSYKVIFMDGMGVIMEEVSADYGNSAIPSKSPTSSGKVFVGWDKDISAVTDNLVCNPVWKDTTDKNNLFTLSSCYAKKGDEIVIPVKLCGNVNIGAFDIRIAFDTEKLEFVEVLNQDADVMASYSDTEKKIGINFMGSENLTESMDVCDLVFKVKSDEVSNTTFNVMNMDSLVYKDNGDFEFVETDYIEATIYIVK